jgi:hypothetical protein
MTFAVTAAQSTKRLGANEKISYTKIAGQAVSQALLSFPPARFTDVAGGELCGLLDSGPRQVLDRSLKRGILNQDGLAALQEGDLAARCHKVKARATET